MAVETTTIGKTHSTLVCNPVKVKTFFSDEPPSGDLIDEIEEINFDDWLEDPSSSRNQSTTVQFH